MPISKHEGRDAKRLTNGFGDTWPCCSAVFHLGWWQRILVSGREYMDVDALIAFLIANGRKWISDQRELHNPHSAPLSQKEIGIFQRFFCEETIKRVRVRHVPRIENPLFYADLARAGVPIPFDFRKMAGITFDDTILTSDLYVHAQPRISLLFHEMVHVVQYGLLGVSEFTKQYVQGWVQNRFVYAEIPLECDAYKLQQCFERTPQFAFSVEEIVETRLGKAHRAT